MARRLPTDPVKRRQQIFKRIFQHLEHWQALREDRGMGDVITTEDGEDIFMGDLMVGLSYLPPRQRQAFELICLQGFTETAARDVLLPHSKSSTPVQQYADSGLIRMIAAYDAKQAGCWPPVEVPKKPKPTKRRLFTMPTLHPIVREGLENTLAGIVAQIQDLEKARLQVEQLLGITGPASLKAGVGQVKQPVPEPTQPAPNPKPEGRPSLTEAAKELATQGV